MTDTEIDTQRLDNDNTYAFNTKYTPQSAKHHPAQWPLLGSNSSFVMLSSGPRPGCNSSFVVCVSRPRVG